MQTKGRLIMGHISRGILLVTGVTLVALSIVVLCQTQESTSQETIVNNNNNKANSEIPRSQSNNNNNKQLARRNGGNTNNHHHHSTSNMPELADDAEAGDLFVNEDGNYETTSAQQGNLLMDANQPPSVYSTSPEYEADSSTELIELTPQQAHNIAAGSQMHQLTPAAVAAAAQMQQQHQAQHLRLLRQSSPQSTRFNLDQNGRGAQQVQAPLQMMQVVQGTTTQQTPRNLQQQQQQQAQRPQNNNGLLPINSVVTTTMATRTQNQQLPAQVMNNIAPRGFQQQAAAQANQQRNYDQQPASSNLHTSQQQSNLASGSTFNVNMGADRMMIKPQQQQQQQQFTTTRANAISPGDQEMVTESVNHELLMSSSRQENNPQNNMMDSSNQDLSIYPNNGDNFLHQTTNPSRQQIASLNSNQIVSDHLRAASASAQQIGSFQNQEQVAQTICYTPVALLIVILVTMLFTVVVCFATHFLIKHLGRHQFDLIANSKQFDTKHGSGYLSGAGNNPSRNIDGNQKQQQQMMMHLAHEPEGSGKSSGGYMGAKGGGFSGAGGRSEQDGGLGFDNPYFRDESQLPAGSAYLRTGNSQQQPTATQLEANQNYLNHQQSRLDTALSTSQLTGGNSEHNVCKTLANQSQNEHQLDFIEHHISNLHNKQVTSSVKELSILGTSSSEVVTSSGASNAPFINGHVVDLTSEEQRARVITDPKEGDLVAVDLTGHDFIGLGFDVCGNAQEGIFIRSVLSRGPARESNCIHPGDRIKCLNISFDNITLQDACDILNCGSPYKLRLLLEKRVLPPKVVAEKHGKPQPAPINSRLIPGRVNNLLLNNQLLAQQQQQQMKQSASATVGPFTATKSYLKRLAGSLMSSSSTNSQSNLNNYRDHQFGITTPAFNTSSEHQLLASNDQYLTAAGGSNSNALIGNGRRLHHHHHSSLFSPTNQDHQAHINPGYGSDDETGDELAIVQQQNLNQSQRLRLSQGGDSIGSHQMRAGRFSVTSADMFGSINDGFGGNYSSLGYHNRNANHRLHGPPLVDERNRPTGETHTNLRVVASHDTMVDGVERSNHHHHNKSLLNKAIKDQHLEQTQSQPEIAQTHDSDSRQMMDDLAMNNNGNNNNNSQRPYDQQQQHHQQHQQQQRNGRSQLMNSMSTPAMNLLLNSSSSQRQTDNNTKLLKRDSVRGSSIREEQSAGKESTSGKL